MFLIHKIQYEKGQATVEAAIMIPVIFILILLLLQPGIILYDLTVMNEAAAEGCRVLSSASDSTKHEYVEPFIRRRLGAIPQQDNFHIHSGECKYKITLEGNENSDEVSTEISNELKPLPIIGFLASCIGILNENKNFEIKASCSQLSRPTWVRNSPSGDKIEKWVGAWLN